MSIRDNLVKPYWAAADKDEDTLPGLDFNRDLEPPGKNEHFPDGVVGIRCDGDFWAVAALPWSYRDTPLPELVADLWPQWADKAVYRADHGTFEQRVEFTNNRAEHNKQYARHMDRENRKLRDEIARLEAERPEARQRNTFGKRWATDTYFIRQYEVLLSAVAHEFEGREDPAMAGCCKHCGLYTTDHVHMKHWIEIRKLGLGPRGVRGLPSFPERDGYGDDA
jgi:hypothetical protein